MPAQVPEHDRLTPRVGDLAAVSVGVDEVAGLLTHPPVGGHVGRVTGLSPGSSQGGKNSKTKCVKHADGVNSNSDL